MTKNEIELIFLSRGKNVFTSNNSRTLTFQRGIIMSGNGHEVGNHLLNLQRGLRKDGTSLLDFLDERYHSKWIGKDIFHVMQVRTVMMQTVTNNLIKAGLLNMEGVQMSLITDPLNHDVESTPHVDYLGWKYTLTHSMIYAKFLALMNPNFEGVFVDSPNIRLEMRDVHSRNRNKYLADFRQVDIELKRSGIDRSDENYQDTVLHQKLLERDMELAFNFFEKLFVAIVTDINEHAADALEKLEVTLEVPKTPFPRFYLDDAFAKYGKDYEKVIHKQEGHSFFWVLGLLRENYDAVYPFDPKNTNPPSKTIYNYDLCCNGWELMSGAVREWNFNTIVERLLANRILSEAPVLKGGCIQNIEKLGGYGPFLMMAMQPEFSATWGGGFGIERSLFAFTQGPHIKSIEDVTLFGKNPDASQVFPF